MSKNKSNAAKSEPALEKKTSATTLWLCVVIAFLILIAAWTTLIKVANENKVETVPLESAKAQRSQGMNF